MADRPRKYNVLNILMDFHVFPDEAQGKYCLVECLVPVGAGAPPNHHAGETEAFYVLDGAIGFMLNGEERLLKAGDFLAIPDGALHAFQAVGETPARVLILNAPGKMHEAFFTGIGEALPADQTTLPDPKEPDLPAVLAMAHRVGMSIPSPAEQPA